MIQIKTKIGARGQLVIPRMIRESLGITDNTDVILEVDKKIISIKSFKDKDIFLAWKEIAKKEGCNVKKELQYGNLFYHEVFSK